MWKSLLNELAHLAGNLIRWTIYLPAASLMSTASKWPWAAGAIVSFGTGWYFFEQGQYKSAFICALAMIVLLLIHFEKIGDVAEVLGKGVGKVFNIYVEALTFTHGRTVWLFTAGASMFLVGLMTANMGVAAIGVILIIGGIISPIAQGIHGKKPD
jgi:preprotein translocase subunit SecG